VRAKVEHPFRILKRVFGFDKVRYRGLAKNHQTVVRQLHPGESLPAPQTWQCSGRTASQGCKNCFQTIRFAGENAPRPPESIRALLTSRNHRPTQRFPRSLSKLVPFAMFCLNFFGLSIVS
jgi:hypothetical protein